MQPFSSLLPAPKYKEKNNVSMVSTVKNVEDEKDTVIFDALRPTNLPTVSFRDFIPLRQRNLDLKIASPTQEEIKNTYVKTKSVLDNILRRKLGSSSSSSETTQNGLHAQSVVVGMGHSIRNLEVKEHRVDPLQPVRFKHRKVVAPVEDIQTPVLNKSDERKTRPTKEELEQWKIPAAISNWKNPNGYAIPLQGRVSVDSRYRKKEAVELNENYIHLATALDQAEKDARERISRKQDARKHLAEQDAIIKEEKIRQLAEISRKERYHSRTFQDKGHFLREKERDEMRRNASEEIRNSKLSTAERLRKLAYSQGRDVSEKVVLNAAKATATPDIQYDSRLFMKSSQQVNQKSDQLYDTPLFNANGISNVYRTQTAVSDEADEILENISNKRGRVGPVEFTAAENSENDNSDASQYGLQIKKARKD